MTKEKLREIQRFFDQLDDYKECIPTDEIVEEYALELLDEVERLRAALTYIGHYNSAEAHHHEPNTEVFHLKEVARENLEYDVDYREHVKEIL
jgi:hypothetical protein